MVLKTIGLVFKILIKKLFLYQINKNTSRYYKTDEIIFCFYLRDSKYHSYNLNRPIRLTCSSVNQGPRTTTV